jgi:hypothetical protein
VSRVDVVSLKYVAGLELDFTDRRLAVAPHVRLARGRGEVCSTVRYSLHASMVGRTISRYRIVAELGQGGMGCGLQGRGSAAWPLRRAQGPA